MYMEVIMNSDTKSEVNGLSIAGLVFGILAIITCWMVVFVPFNAGMAITMSCLSRGGKKMNGISITGCVLAGISLFIAVLLMILMVSLMVGNAAGVMFNIFDNLDCNIIDNAAFMALAPLGSLSI